MNILFVTDLYPVEDGEKNTPKTLFNFVEGWRDESVDVSVLKPNFLFNSYVRKKPYYKTGQYGNVFNVNYIMPFLGNVREKLGDFKVDEYDIVVAHMPSGILFADKLGLPFIAGIHNSDIEILSNPLYAFHFRKREIKALWHAKAIACRSYVIKNKLLKMFPQFEGKTFVAPSGIDEKYIINDFTHSLNKDKLKIVTCANLIKRKNVDKIIHGIKDIEGVELFVIGDGEDLIRLKSISSDNVVFLGRLPHKDVFNVMRNSDIFILPSIKETFGMVYLEAMASGCITICSKYDGIDGIIENGKNGFIIKPDESSVREIIQKIKGMDTEGLNKIRENSLQTIRQFTEDACCESYLKNIKMYMK